ncbi:MAG: hypothetical protein PHE33_02600, partial [Bacteroidales bacterium]|nr:hypothetical protein [Bacteroidales bacterium]
MKKTFLIFIGIVVGVCLSLGVFGQILTFEFSALAGNEASATSNSNDANLASSTITRGAGLTASGNSGRFNATNWALTSIANAVSGNNYMEFTITPNSGYQFSVSSIVVQWQRSATGNTAISLRSSVDAYASDLDAVKSVTDNTSTQTFTWTFTQSNSTAAVTYRLYSYAEATGGSGGAGDGSGNDITVNGNVTASGPTITLTPTTLNGFTYEDGAGPSTPAKTFTVAGSNLTTDISIAAPTNYEISKTSGSGYATPLTFTQSGGSVTTQTVYVRLKSGLAVGVYNSETITASSTGATDKTVTCSGTVSELLLAAWDFYGQSSPATFAATTFDGNLISTAGANLITRGAGATSSVGSNSFRTTGFENNGISTANTDYFQITLTTEAGYAVSLSTIDANFAGTSTFYASPGVTSQFAYSTDGTNFTLIGSPETSTSLSLTQIDLSGISQLQNVPDGTTISLRYYASGQTTTGGWGLTSVAAGTNGLAIRGNIISTSIISAQTGPWSSTTTWVGGVVPTSSDNALIKSGHTVTMDNSTYSTRNSGVITTVEVGGTLATNLTYTNNGTTTINGSFKLVDGGWANGSNFVYGANGTLEFNTSGAYGVDNTNVFWPITSGPYNVSVLSGGLNLGSSSQADRTVSGIFQTGSGVTLSNSSVLTVNGICRINTGGWFNNAATYGSSSTLNYNTGSNYGRNIEFSSTTAGTPGYPYNVQISDNTNLNPGANSGTNTAWIIGGNLTVDSGSGFYADFGSDHMVSPITILGNLTVNGGLALSGNAGADLK